LDAATYPGALDAWYDGIDSNCDGADDFDADADGYSATVFGGTDCDDTLNSVHPFAPELADGLDNDCDGHDETWTEEPEVDSDVPEVDSDAPDVDSDVPEVDSDAPEVGDDPLPVEDAGSSGPLDGRGCSTTGGPLPPLTWILSFAAYARSNRSSADGRARPCRTMKRR
jgi:hypothetical protein